MKPRSYLSVAVASIFGAGAALLAALSTVEQGQAQGLSVPTVRVQTDAINRAIRTATRLALNAKLAIKQGQALVVNTMALSTVSRYLVTGLGDGSARVWDLQLGREIKKLAAHSGGITTIAVNGDGSLLATAGGDGIAQLWKMPDGVRAGRFDTGAGPVNGMALDETGSRLITAGEDGEIRLWDTSTGRETGRLTGHVGPITSLVITSDSQWLITGGRDRTVRVWEVTSRRELFRLEGHRGTVTSVAVTTGGEFIVSADTIGDIKVWERATGHEKRAFDNWGAAILSVAINDNGSFVASGGQDNVVRLYDMETGQETRSFRGHAGAVRVVNFEPTNQFLHTASVDGTSRVWDLPTGDELAKVISTKSGWVVADTTGRYDGSDGGINSVEWRTNEGPFELDQFFDQWYEPGILANVIEAGQPAGESVDPIPAGFPVPPKVKILSNGDVQAADRPGIDLTLEANDAGGGIEDVRLYHNGKLVVAGTFCVELVSEERDEGQMTRRLIVPLIAGQNYFQAIALNEKRIESRPTRFTVNHAGGERDSMLHLVAIGINRYKNPALNLNYGVHDATGVANFFNSMRDGPFGEVRIYELFDDAATRSGVVEYLQIVRDSKPEDVILVFLAGHGNTADGRWFFVPYDLTRPDRSEDLSVPRQRLWDKLR